MREEIREEGGRGEGREEEGGSGLGRWVTIEKRSRHFLLKAKLASERPGGLSLVCVLHPPPQTSIFKNLRLAKDLFSDLVFYNMYL